MNLIKYLDEQLKAVRYPVQYANIVQRLNVARYAGKIDETTLIEVNKRLDDYETNNPIYKRKR